MKSNSKRGRPKRGTLSLDDVITRYLIAHGGKAEWKDLKDARPGKPISDSALKDAIDRLVRLKRIEAQAILRGGKSVTLYCLPQGVPNIEINDERLPLAEWLARVLDEIEAAREQDVKMMALPSIEHPAARGMSPIPSHAAVVQAKALADAMRALIIIILDLIDSANSADTEDETMLYLDAASRIYLSILIKEISKIASWRYGNPDEAMKQTKEMLSGRKQE